MMLNKSALSIVIPTYNRADYVDRSLLYHLPIAEKLGVSIYISDNDSFDNTEQVVKAWQNKFSNLFYSKSESNIGAVANVQRALSLSETDYVWLLGDTYLLPETGLQYVLDTMSNNYEIYVFNLVDSGPKEDRIYCDRDKVLSEISGVLSCVSTIVFQRDIVLNADFELAGKYFYPHTKIVLDYLSSAKHFNLAWVGALSVDGLVLESKKKDAWYESEKVFDIGMIAWIDLISSLPSGYGKCAKMEGFKQLNNTNQLFAFTRMINYRIDGILNFERCISLRKEMSLILNYNPLIVFLISIIPIFGLKIAKKLRPRSFLRKLRNMIAK